MERKSGFLPWLVRKTAVQTVRVSEAFRGLTVVLHSHRDDSPACEVIAAGFYLKLPKQSYADMPNTVLVQLSYWMQVVCLYPVSPVLMGCVCLSLRHLDGLLVDALCTL